MPAISNGKHEAFAQAVFSGTSARTAYREHVSHGVSDKVADSAGSRLLKSVKVSARLNELRERVSAKAVWNRAKVVAEMERAVELAREAEQHSASIRALELLGREHNAFIEKKEIGPPGAFDNLSTDELENRLKTLTRGTRRGSPDSPGISLTGEPESLH
jgi:hypothetical protein